MEGCRTRVPVHSIEAPADTESLTISHRDKRDTTGADK